MAIYLPNKVFLCSNLQFMKQQEENHGMLRKSGCITSRDQSFLDELQR